MNVTAKIDGYHPASGLHLTKGADYTINPAHFAADVFIETTPKPAKKEK